VEGLPPHEGFETEVALPAGEADFEPIRPW
jgi:hypothetical protein